MADKLTYENAYREFKNEFKKDIEFIDGKEKENLIDGADGAHVQFGMVVIPYLYHLVDAKDENGIKKCFEFFDKMSTSSDSELSAVVQFSILEDIVSNKRYFNELKDYFTDEMKSYIPYLREYIDFK